MWWKSKQQTEAAASLPRESTRVVAVPREWSIRSRAKKVLDFFRHSFMRIFMFILLILTYLLVKISFRIWYWRTLWRENHGTAESRSAGTPSEILFSRYAGRVFRLFHTSSGTSIDKINLIEIAIRNMKAKKTRTAVTIGGMAIGIGSIVFLVSIGYGLQRLVISQVAELQEMQQADVSLQPGGKIKINDATLADFKQIPNIESVEPLISVVGHVNYQNSVSDVAAYGVTTGYLERSAIRSIQGKFFESNELVFSETENSAVAAKSETIKQRGETINEIAFSGLGQNWVRMREAPDPDAALMGYGKIESTEVLGSLVWGASYAAKDEFGNAGKDTEGNALGKWIKASLSLFEEKTCAEAEADCVNGKYLLLRDENEEPVTKVGYFAVTDEWLVLRDISSEEKEKLTESDGGLATISIKDSGDGWVEVEGEGGEAVTENIERVPLVTGAKKQAVVSRAMLRLLSMDESSAIGKTFNVSFVITGNLLSDSQKKIESVADDYTIVAVIPEDKSPIFFVPFIDLRGLGIEYYSQVKITTTSQEVLPDVRRQIESMGYTTQSVSDTVSQINSFFASARIILGLLGMVALGVAALGMFNTLTVSLLERTREVGLMKAIGMKSVEVQELFLTESMVMAFFGGILGLLVGIVGGKLLGALLSVLSIFKGAGTIDVSYVPTSFIVAILVFSLIVGIITGVYPARRATSISALNALRYE